MLFKRNILLTYIGVVLILAVAGLGVGLTRALFLDQGASSASQIGSDFITAYDDLESGGTSGGWGWLDTWAITGTVTATSASAPYAGTYHMLIDKGADATRSTNLSGQTNMRLQLWGKVTGLSGPKEAWAEVSSDGSAWTTVRTWTSADLDGVYQYEDIDLSPYAMSAQFYVRFSIDGTGGGSRSLYVDNVTFASRLAPPPTPTPTPTPMPTATPTATPTPVPPVATDNFESGDLIGGTGWLDTWTVTGAVSVTSANTPQEGTNHMLVDKGADAKRFLDVFGQSALRLKFWAKVTGLSGQRQGHAEVSSDGTSWTEVRTWTTGDPDNVYAFEGHRPLAVYHVQPVLGALQHRWCWRRHPEPLHRRLGDQPVAIRYQRSVPGASVELLALSV